MAEQPRRANLKADAGSIPALPSAFKSALESIDKAAAPGCLLKGMDETDIV